MVKEERNEQRQMNISAFIADNWALNLDIFQEAFVL